MLGRRRQPNIKMLVGECRCFSSPRRPFDEPLLNQIGARTLPRLSPVLRPLQRQGVDADRSAVILFKKAQQDAFVHFIEAVIIHFQCEESVVGDLTGNDSPVVVLQGRISLRKIPASPEETVGNAWCPP